MSNIDVVAIIGPTASGKTALSIKLAKEINGEIINGDSMQIYKGMDIGTAKITKEEMDGVPHHLLDIKEPTESFSVAEYQKLVRGKIEEIKSRGKMPIIVGGTGLYIQSVLYDFVFTDEEVDTEARTAYYNELEKIGPEAMHARLAKLDPKTAETIHPNNTRRVIRALEMVELSGTSKAAIEAGATMLAVATPDEAVHIREHFHEIDILILGAVPPAFQRKRSKYSKTRIVEGNTSELQFRHILHGQIPHNFKAA